MSDVLKPVNEYPEALRETVRALRKLQGGIDRHNRVADLDREARNKLLEELVAGGMGPKEVMAIIGMTRNAYYQRAVHRNRS